MDALVEVDLPVESGRHPFEMFVLVAGLLAGIPLVIFGPTHGSTAELLGPVLARVWGCVLAGSCLTALVGVLWSPAAKILKKEVHRGTGMLTEQVGLVGLGVGTLIYAIGLGVFDTPLTSRLVPIALVGALGLASLWRAHQIGRWIQAAISAQDRRR